MFFVVPLDAAPAGGVGEPMACARALCAFLWAPHEVIKMETTLCRLTPPIVFSNPGGNDFTHQRDKSFNQNLQTMPSTLRLSQGVLDRKSALFGFGVGSLLDQRNMLGKNPYSRILFGIIVGGGL